MKSLMQNFLKQRSEFLIEFFTCSFIVLIMFFLFVLELVILKSLFPSACANQITCEERIRTVERSFDGIKLKMKKSAENCLEITGLDTYYDHNMPGFEDDLMQEQETNYDLIKDPHRRAINRIKRIR